MNGGFLCSGFQAFMRYNGLLACGEWHQWMSTNRFLDYHFERSARLAGKYYVEAHKMPHYPHWAIIMYDIPYIKGNFTKRS
jgi:hypothetical protein